MAILFLRSKHFKEEGRKIGRLHFCSLANGIAQFWLDNESLQLEFPFYFGEEVLQYLKISRELVVRQMSFWLKAPMNVYVETVQFLCEKCVCGARPRLRFLRVFLVLFYNFLAAILIIIVAPFCLVFFLCSLTCCLVFFFTLSHFFDLFRV